MPHYLRTDVANEAVSALEIVSESVTNAKSDTYRWKWAVVALHNSVQGFMVLSLHGGNGLAALEDTVAAEWLVAYRNNGPYPKERLDGYENLYKKVKGDRMMIYCHSKKFVPAGTQGRSIKRLKRLRDEFIHFVPKGWCLEVSGLPALFTDCLDFIDFLGWDCGNVIWHDAALESRARTAMTSTRVALRCVEALYGA